MSKDFNLPTNDIFFSTNLLKRYEGESCDSEEVKHFENLFRSFQQKKLILFFHLFR